MPMQQTRHKQTYRFTRDWTALLVFLLAMSPLQVLAQWRTQPSVGLGGEYDTNATLDTGASIDTAATGYLLDAAADISYDTPTSQFLFRPEVLVKRYDSNQDLDSDEYFATLNYSYAGERFAFDLLGDFGDEAARTAERSGVDFGVDNPDQIPIDNSGVIISTGKRKRFHINPEWSLKASQRSTVHIGASYIDVTYDDQIAPFFTNYSEFSGVASAEFLLTERDSLEIGGYYRENYFEVQDRDYSGYGATVGLLRAIREDVQLILRVGLDSSEDEAGDKQQNPIGEISLVRNLPRARLLASYRRAVTGSGAGVLSVRDSVSLNIKREFTQRLTFGIGMRAYKTSSIDKGVSSLDDRRYFQLRGLMSWRVAEKFSIDLDYYYTYLDRETVVSSADSNLVNLWFRYGRSN